MNFGPSHLMTTEDSRKSLAHGKHSGLHKILHYHTTSAERPIQTTIQLQTIPLFAESALKYLSGCFTLTVSHHTLTYGNQFTQDIQGLWISWLVRMVQQMRGPLQGTLGAIRRAIWLGLRAIQAHSPWPCPDGHIWRAAPDWDKCPKAQTEKVPPLGRYFFSFVCPDHFFSCQDVWMSDVGIQLPMRLGSRPVAAVPVVHCTGGGSSAAVWSQPFWSCYKNSIPFYNSSLKLLYSASLSVQSHRQFASASKRLPSALRRSLKMATFATFIPRHNKSGLPEFSAHQKHKKKPKVFLKFQLIFLGIWTGLGQLCTYARVRTCT